MLSVLLEFVGQHRFGTMELRGRCAFRDVEQPGDFLVLLSLDDMEVEDGAVSVGQFPDHAVYGVGGDVLRVGVFVGRFRALPVEFREFQPSAFPDELQRFVEGDFGHPSFQRARALVGERRDGGENLQEAVLQHVPEVFFAGNIARGYGRKVSDMASV